MPRNQPDTPKPFSLTAFKAFVDSKPRDEVYPRDYNSCAIAQFGFKGVNYGNCATLGISNHVYAETAYGQPTTFGALSDRLAKVMSL